MESDLMSKLEMYLKGDPIDINILESASICYSELVPESNKWVDLEIKNIKDQDKSLQPVTVNYSVLLYCNMQYKLKSICDAIAASKFTPNKFPTAVSRIDGCTALVYPQERLKVVGLKEEEKVRFYLHCFRLLLGGRSPQLHEKLKFSGMNIMNIVCMASIDAKYIHNDNMHRNLTYSTSYAPELFPCLIYYHNDFTANIFDSGNITLLGLKSNSEKKVALKIVLDHIHNSIPTGPLKDEFNSTYIDNPSPPGVTSPKKKKNKRKLEDDKDREDLRFSTNDPTGIRKKRMFSTSTLKQTKSTFTDRINKKYTEITEKGTLFACIHNVIIKKHEQQMRINGIQ